MGKVLGMTCKDIGNKPWLPVSRKEICWQSSCYYIIAGGYAYAYVIASGCVVSLLNAHGSCNTPALYSLPLHIYII